MTSTERNLLGIADDKFETIDALGTLLAQHKLVPFVGAGISRQHLGFAGGELARDMAQLLGKPPETLLSTLADSYIDVLGIDAFVAFLRQRLTVTAFDESKAPIHRLLLSLSPRVVYTTNQDNLFELTASHYGRTYQRVVTLQDLSETVPGDPMLIKFHGDADVPDSLVFGARSYQKRMETDRHPLDIRLQSDLLGKQLLFIGYSLQDENVAKLLATVKKSFGGQMPQSYLLAYEYDPSMEELSSMYGVRVINPTSFFSDPISPHDAFERLLKAICDSTIKYQTKKGLETLLGGGQTNARMVTEFEIDALEKIVEAESFNDAVLAFRGLIDQTTIPSSLLGRCTRLFQRITERADPMSKPEMDSLKGMLFNFRVPIGEALSALAFVMAACNKRPRVPGYDDFLSLVCPAVPDDGRPAAAAMAVAILAERNEEITDQFRHLAATWFEGFDELPETSRDMVKKMIAVAWPGPLAAQSPLNRPQLGLRSKGFHSIMRDMMDTFPKKLQTPKE